MFGGYSVIHLNKTRFLFGTVSSRPLVVDTADGVPAAPLQTRPESAVHLLLHLSISPLHCAQVPLAGVIPLNLETNTI